MNADLVLPRLWLGNKTAAFDEEFLKTNSVDAVFNCTKQLPFSPVVKRMYRVPVDDNLEASEIANMEKWAPEIVYKVVREYKSGSTLLIHCHAGMQRSAAVVAMTLMALGGMNPDEAMAYIRSKRPVAFFPAANFEKSIRGFHRHLQDQQR